jgi:hypothetical protein
MGGSNVQAILDQIQQLPEADRLLLEQRLAELAETEWRRETETARRLAREKGLDQATIDRAIHDLRYRS